MAKDVTIVGAGIVGLTLARLLAERGVNAVVYDSKRSVSEGASKASGIFSLSGLKRIGIPYEGAIVNTLYGARLHGGGRCISVQSHEPKAYVVDRGELAESCREAAERAGATVNLNHRISKVGLEAIASDRNAIVVGADGAVSTVANAFQFPAIAEHVLTYKAEYSGADVSDTGTVDIVFDNNVMRGFFGWAVPYSHDRLELAVGVSGSARIPSSRAFERFASMDKISRIIGGAMKTSGLASMIPLKARAMTVKGNVALVGDAAGQVKATTGGGIIFGVSCARVLADVISDKTRGGDAKLESYERVWRRMYGIDLKLHEALHGFYSRLGNRGFAGLFTTMRVMGAEPFLGKYGDMDRPSLVLKRALLRGLSD